MKSWNQEAAMQKPSARPASATATPWFDLSLLYVEDDRDSRNIMTFILQRRFRQVLVSENGYEGLQVFICNRPDLVLTDIRMPEMDGIEMALAIHRLSPDTPVICLSAHGDEWQIEEAMSAGMADYLIKPLDIDALDESLHGIFGKKPAR